jgi:hypothetical protein
MKRQIPAFVVPARKLPSERRLVSDVGRAPDARPLATGIAGDPSSTRKGPQVVAARY